MSSESVKVCDLELEKLGELAKCWDEIDDILGEYVQIMKNTYTESVKAGHIHDAIDNLSFEAEKFRNIAQGLGARAASIAKALVKTAETVDLNLYNEV